MYALADMLTAIFVGFLAGASMAGIAPLFIKSCKLYKEQKRLDTLTKRALEKAIDKVFCEGELYIVDINGEKSVERI